MPSFRLNNMTLLEWEDWLKSELAPPHNLDKITYYVAESFLEAVVLLKKFERHLKQK